jgi:hypothetical protein
MDYYRQEETAVNNLEWFSKVKEFCLLSETCQLCPYFCLQENGGQPQKTDQCFKDKESLEALSLWLAQPCRENLADQGQEGDNNQWLKDLINKQFEEDETDEDFFLEEMLH